MGIDKQRLAEAVWENPSTLFCVEFKRRGNGARYKDSRKAGLSLGYMNGTLTVFANHGSGKAGQQWDIFSYVEEQMNTCGFVEACQEIGRRYGIPIELSPEEHRRMERAQLATEIAKGLADELNSHPTGETATYLSSRGVVPDGVHVGEFTEEGIKRIVSSLLARGIKLNVKEDMKALGLEYSKANSGYNLAIPYYHNGRIDGFLLRLVRKPDKGQNKYSFPADVSRCGFCDRLEYGKPAVIVEGEMDAIRLIQLGMKNVIAMGTSKMSEAVARLLKSKRIDTVTYIPDSEFSMDRERENTTTDKAVETFLSAQADGKRIINNLYVAQIPAPTEWDRFPKFKDGVQTGYKIDADDYGRVNPDGMKRIAADALPAWEYQLERVFAGAEAMGEELNLRRNINGLQDDIDRIYLGIRSSHERDRFKQLIDRYEQQGCGLSLAGITRKSFEDIDEWRRDRDYNDRIQACSKELTAAIADGANPVVVSDIIERLSEAQGTNTRDEWEQQLAQTYEDELEEIRRQPEALKTKWRLGTVNNAGTFFRYNDITFDPAGITIFCAPTSHGKTMILVQSMLDLIAATGKTFLYVSCEENKRKLMERVINAYIPVGEDDNGKDKDGNDCFITGYRKQVIKSVLMGNPAPVKIYHPDGIYAGDGNYTAMAGKVLYHLEEYKDKVRPKLRLIHSDASAESICSNIKHYVEKWKEEGTEIGGVFVDYMQLLTTDAKGHSRQDELKGVCKALNTLAASIELPIVIAAQLNREAIRNGIDEVTIAHIGEAADIERIASDVYFLWQVDKTKQDMYFTFPSEQKPAQKAGNVQEMAKWNGRGAERAERLFTRKEYTFRDKVPYSRTLKTGYMYIEQLKARDGKSGGWGLLPFDGERGFIGENDIKKMAE